MKIFREVKGIPEPEEGEEGKKEEQGRIAMKPVEHTAEVTESSDI